MTVGADAFDELQLRLGPALHANRPGSGIDHVMVTLPSFSVSESILSHYGNRIASLEHRYLTAVLIVGRITDCHTVIVLSRLPDPAIIEYYLQLVPADERASARSRTTLIEVQDGTNRSVAAKLLDRADLLGQIRATVGDLPALIEPWNVTENEVELALALGVPINGSNPRVRGLGFKSEGRRLMRRAGVPVPFGVEDICSADDVVAAVRTIREERPNAPGVVVKHDDSGAGDGNVVIDLGPMDAAAADPEAWLREQFQALPNWYRADLERGGIVEERIAGDRFTSPSAQVDIRPGGRVVVIATHEQVLGGESGQVYLGCRFPADPAYAPELARHAAAIGEGLAAAGALGRFSVDFVASADREAEEWRVHALEINLRKGGTTHPYAAMRNVVPGRYDAATGRWLTDDGGERFYSATDNLLDPAWLGLSPTAVISAVADAGLQFDPQTGTGVVLHMLSGLAIDGRFGLTAIAETPDDAARMHEATREAVATLARS
jgi:PGM1 C-terminal domain